MLVGSQLKNAQIECLTTTQINALGDKVRGRVVYDVTIKQLLIYNGTAWIPANEIYATDGTSKILDCNDGSTAAEYVGNVQGNVTGNVQGNVTGTTSSIANHDTGDLSEGSNLYYTNTRADARIASETVTKFRCKTMGEVNGNYDTIEMDETETITDTYFENLPANTVFRMTCDFFANIHSPWDGASTGWDASYAYMVATAYNSSTDAGANDAFTTNPGASTRYIQMTTRSKSKLIYEYGGAGTDFHLYNRSLGSMNTMVFKTPNFTTYIKGVIQLSGPNIDIYPENTYIQLEELHNYTETTDWD